MVQLPPAVKTAVATTFVPDLTRNVEGKIEAKNAPAVPFPDTAIFTVVVVLTEPAKFTVAKTGVVVPAA